MAIAGKDGGCDIFPATPYPAPIWNFHSFGKSRGVKSERRRNLGQVKGPLFLDLCLSSPLKPPLCPTGEKKEARKWIQKEKSSGRVQFGRVSNFQTWTNFEPVTIQAKLIRFYWNCPASSQGVIPHPSRKSADREKAGRSRRQLYRVVCNGGKE